jgi:hypothetical protein
MFPSSSKNHHPNGILITIQLMIFDEVDTMLYQPRRSDNARHQRLLGLININVNRYQKSTIVLLNYLTSII